MRRLTPMEANAVKVLAKRGSFVPDITNPRDMEAAAILDGLVKKRRVQTEVFDGSVRYSLTFSGLHDAE